MPNESFEIKIVAENAAHEVDTKYIEYRAVNASTPGEAASELFRGLTQASKDRCREIEPDR